MTWSISPIEGIWTICHTECSGTDVIGGEFQTCGANTGHCEGLFLEWQRWNIHRRAALRGISRCDGRAAAKRHACHASRSTVQRRGEQLYVALQHPGYAKVIAAMIHPDGVTELPGIIAPNAV